MTGAVVSSRNDDHTRRLHAEMEVYALERYIIGSRLIWECPNLVHPTRRAGCTVSDPAYEELKTELNSLIEEWGLETVAFLPLNSNNLSIKRVIEELSSEREEYEIEGDYESHEAERYKLKKKWELIRKFETLVKERGKDDIGYADLMEQLMEEVLI